MSDPSNPTRFVVLTSPRSGSTWFIDTLHCHPDAVVYGEPFKPNRKKPFRFGAQSFDPYVPYRRERGRALWPPASIAYLRDLYATGEGSRAVGFKLMYGHARSHALASLYLRATSVSVVHLVRTNAVDAVISRYAMDARGKSGGHDTADRPVVHETVRVDPAEFVARVEAHERTVQRMRRVLRVSRIRSTEVVYEELSADPAGEIGRVATFLGLDPSSMSLESQLRKIASGPQGAIIENFGEVRAALVASGHGGQLRDGHVEPVATRSLR
jgi:LPS sulfotransferase NodH